MSVERGGIVVGWLFRIMLMLALIAVISFETGAVLVAKVTADRVAIAAADEAGRVFFETGSSEKAKEAAQQVAAQDKAMVVAFQVQASGRSVELTVRKVASTFLIQHIGPLRRFRDADSTHTGKVQ